MSETRGMEDEGEAGLMRAAPVLPGNLPAEVVALIPYQPMMRQALAAAKGCPHGRLSGTISASYVRTNSILLMGPVIGAPAAAILLEGLIAGGLRDLLVLGVCGSLTEEVGAGDLILAKQAYSAEGTSGHYFPDRKIFPANPNLLDRLRRWLAGGQSPFLTGALVSTDAPFRETPGFVKEYQTRGAAGVDMELSAIYALGQFHGVRTAGLMIVSDELAGGEWRPGFKRQRFNHRCRQLLSRLLETGLG